MSATASKYPVTYWSESKKQKVRIEDMATPWLANAWRKAGGTSLEADGLQLRSAMWDELRSRGCTYDDETGQWTFPPKPGDNIDREAT